MFKSDNPYITIGFTSHRIETLTYAKRLMEKHDIIIIEEAPTPNFVNMLNKKISIAKYIREEYLEFPKFSFRYYNLLRKLYYSGKKILQVEPYMEKLFVIYEMFSNGKKPSDILAIPDLKDVYIAEKNATAALLDFYENSLKNSFIETVNAVIRFAKADAQRFRLRDKMRADAIIKAIDKDEKFYIEAGGIHIFLEKILRTRLGKNYYINTVFLLEPFIQKLTGKKEFLSPGDLLTKHYIFDKKGNKKFENLLAARSLIYIMLLKKEEMIPTKTTEAPHLEHEIKIIEFVNKLSFTQCEELYKKIRFGSQ